MLPDFASYEADRIFVLILQKSSKWLFIHCLLRLRLPIVSSIKNMTWAFASPGAAYE